MVQVKCKMHYDSYILYFLSLTSMYVPSLISIPLVLSRYGQDKQPL